MNSQDHIAVIYDHHCPVLSTSAWLKSEYTCNVAKSKHHLQRQTAPNDQSHQNNFRALCGHTRMADMTQPISAPNAQLWYWNPWAAGILNYDMGYSHLQWTTDYLHSSCHLAKPCSMGRHDVELLPRPCSHAMHPVGIPIAIVNLPDMAYTCLGSQSYRYNNVSSCFNWMHAWAFRPALINFLSWINPSNSHDNGVVLAVVMTYRPQICELNPVSCFRRKRCGSTDLWKFDGKGRRSRCY
jgi:hypothetical protein